MAETLFDMEPTAIFSDCGLYRYFLERRWGPGKAVLCNMLNPSWAGSKQATDHTTEKCCTIWKGWGFGAHWAVNTHPHIEADPKQMQKHMANLKPAVRKEIMERNLSLILEKAPQAGLIVAAWGRVFDPSIPELITKEILKLGLDIYCLGTNKDGSPRHPLSRGKNHVPVNQQPVLWRAADND
jgi:hypothetical protein